MARAVVTLRKEDHVKCCQPATEGHVMALIEKGEARGQPVDQQKSSWTDVRSLGDLWNQPQARRWILRACVAVAVGAVFAWVIDIRVGLTLAIIAIIADTVFKARSSG